MTATRIMEQNYHGRGKKRTARALFGAGWTRHCNPGHPRMTAEGPGRAKHALKQPEGAV